MGWEWMFFIPLAFFFGGCVCCYQCVCECSLARECFTASHGMAEWDVLSGTFTMSDSNITTTSANAMALFKVVETTTEGGYSCNIATTNSSILNGRIIFAYTDSSNYSFLETYPEPVTAATKMRVGFVQSGSTTYGDLSITSGTYLANIRLCWNEVEILITSSDLEIPYVGYSCQNVRETAAGRMGIGTGSALSGGSATITFAANSGGFPAAMVAFEPAEVNEEEGDNECCNCCPYCDKECNGELPESLEVTIPSGYFRAMRPANSSRCDVCETEYTGTFVLNRMAVGDHPDQVAVHCNHYGNSSCLYYYNFGSYECDAYTPSGHSPQYSDAFTVHAVLTARIFTGAISYIPVTQVGYSTISGFICDPTQWNNRDVTGDGVPDEETTIIEVILWVRSTACVEVGIGTPPSYSPALYRQATRWIGFIPTGISCVGSYDLSINLTTPELYQSVSTDFFYRHCVDDEVLDCYSNSTTYFVCELQASPGTISVVIA